MELAIFTSLDLASGYWQVELDENARHKSAFTTYNGPYEFIRIHDPNERKYVITELETLAVMWAAQKFCPYLLGHHATVLTDHSACVSVLTSARPSGKLAR